MMFSVSLIICLMTFACSEKSTKSSRAATRLPPCSACSAFVKSFEEGMEKTSRAKFEGGDTAWEEVNQKFGYLNSEVRFVEIQEQLCLTLDRGEVQCHENHNKWEEYLEEWWKTENRPSLHEFLCINKLSVCCPPDTYGPECLPCSMKDTNGNICSGKGKCKGSGTRKGNGACLCNKSYAGALCDTCAPEYYELGKSCLPCYKGCLGACTGDGPLGCLGCRNGYVFNSELGCADIDECLDGTARCDNNTFCVNTEGTFKCMACDKACKTCDSDGPDNCKDCANGYVINKQGICITEEDAGRIFSMSSTRYVTYFGLCIATAIIFQRSIVISGILGLVITVYITFSEFYLSNSTGHLQPMLF